jgi:WhiB family redox-sensing transcriptional regulator
MDHAACRPHPTRWWFADNAESIEAYLICVTCPVRVTCLAFALDHPDLLGIWGATTPRERARLRHPSLGAQSDNHDPPDR